MSQTHVATEATQAEPRPVLDPTDASGADGANGATDRKPRRPRTTSKAQAARAAAEAKSTKSQPEPKAETKPQAPKPEPAPKPSKYVEDMDVVGPLAGRLAQARANGIGQAVIANLAGVMPFAVWRTERQLKVQPDEVEPLLDALAKIDRGEVPTRQAGGTKSRVSRADMEHRVEVATKTLRAAVENKDLKTRTHWLAVVNEALLTLDLPAAS
jgi:hypothetical protein